MCSQPFKYYIDSPKLDDEINSPFILISGWIITDEGNVIASPTFCNSDICTHLLTVVSRPDVEAAYPNHYVLGFHHYHGRVKNTVNISTNNYDSSALNLIEQFKNGLILDNGCGLRNEYYDNVVNFEIVDYPTDVLGIGEKLPFKSDAFDAIFSLSVLEHVKNPFECVQEINRVLKPGGILYVAVPFLQPFHGYPDHYYNMTSSGLKNLFSGKFEIIECSVPLAGLPIWCLSWFLNSYIRGLPEPVADRFKKMQVSELLNDPKEYLDKDFVKQLSPKANEELACVNYLLGKKRL